jgi:uncharacterized protein involved in exopolysaccharide biosynthesis
MASNLTRSGSNLNGCTVRDGVTLLFRWKRLILTIFGAVFGLVAIGQITQPNVYEAEMKILVKHNRMDTVVSPEATSAARQGFLTEQDLSSEAELMKSRDLLEKAAISCHLPKAPAIYRVSFPTANAFAGSKDKGPDLWQVSEAVRELNDGISAVPLRNSNLISIKFESRNPVSASCVLNTLARLYIDKHLNVHRAGGAYEFFRVEAERYKTQLDEVETRLARFGETTELFTEGVQKDIAIRKLGEYSASLIDTKTSIAEVEARIKMLEKQRAAVRPTQRREVRTLPNPQLTLLKTTLVDLEMKHTQMLQKFNPTYRPVEEMEKQIGQIKTTIAQAEKVPNREESVGMDPEHEWIRLELAKAKSELAALRAAAPAKENAVQTYRALASDLDKKDIERQDLVRLAKIAEEKYELYLRKQEEARVDQELDKQRILNVAIAEEATVPILPKPNQTSKRLSMGLVLATMLSLTIAFAADRWDRTFRTPLEVQAFLAIPVVASIPALPLEGTVSVPALRSENK